MHVEVLVSDRNIVQVFAILSMSNFEAKVLVIE